MTLKAGDPAPDFALEDQHGQTVKLSDYKGRKVILYFYPRADTPGCTTQACSLRDAAEPIGVAGAAVIGISPDKPGAQAKFDTKYGLGFPLLSDPDHAVAGAYGAWGERSMYGKKYMGIVRSAFVIDEAGKVVEPLYKISPKDTVPKALKALG
ncbi:MAG TPA: thioredoxin-dependent thiol peroxidase [Acidimicrobiia bacterium]|nr:thioredoxin-dependent thiol peroxidase [Acidimicrobiia bacterium]